MDVNAYEQMNAYAGMPISLEPPTCEARSNDLAVVAAQLVEAACRACDGDREAAGAHIAHAVALLHGKPSLGPSFTRALPMVQKQVAREGLTAWQTRRLIAHVEANFARRIRRCGAGRAPRAEHEPLFPRVQRCIRC
jgi:hypothetical protein